MQNQYDLKRYAVLYVDDEEKALKYFVKTFGDEFRFLTANNAVDGLKLIEEHGDDIAILLSDQRMPGEKGVQLLERARQLRPRLVRMLVTAYADFSVTVDAVNLGNIFRYISKPLQTEDVRNTLHRGMEFYILQQERDDLLREKLSVLQNLLITDRVMGLGVVATAVSQQLRHPLRAVHAFLELSPGRLKPQNLNLEKLRDPAFWREFHGLVVKQAARIANLLADLSIGQSPDTGFDPAAALQAGVTNQQPALATRGIDLQLKVSGSLPVIQGSEGVFQRAIEMLLTFEQALLSSGAAATLTAGAVQDGPDAGSLRLILTDTGPGIPTDVLRSVFDPFFINIDSPAESGLSLIGAYFLVYHLGGRISSPRSSGSGLRLEITFPTGSSPALTAPDSSREFITNVLMNDTLWERLLPSE
jgi:two-component system probable response regulator PhcQ